MPSPPDCCIYFHIIHSQQGYSGSPPLAWPYLLGWGLFISAHLGHPKSSLKLHADVHEII